MDDDYGKVAAFTPKGCGVEVGCFIFILLIIGALIWGVARLL
jgi:flagellar biogenesis protein FliO